MAISTYLADMWSATEFGDPALSGYAENHMRADTRIGIQTLAAFALAMQLCVSLLATSQSLGNAYVYTSLLFGLLSLHVLISAAFLNEVRSLQALGIAFLVIGATTITVLAHRTGDLNIGMMAAIVMLFVSIPLVPWALREAAIVIGLTYLLLTASFMVVPGRFDSQSLWILQLLILGAATVVVVVTARNTFIRRNDIRARFDLENAHREMELVSMRDHLTGAWNRRFIAERFPDIAGDCMAHGKPLQVAVLDVDDFKGINDQFGHHTGDRILVAIARTFMRHLGNDGYLVRLGGDEFQIIYCSKGLDELIDAAIAELQTGVLAPGIPAGCRVSLSAGLVSAGDGRAANLEDLYKAADRALYRAKQQRPASDSGANVLVRTGTWQL